jgi:hypothetical protein
MTDLCEHCLASAIAVTEGPSNPLALNCNYDTNLFFQFFSGLDSVSSMSVARSLQTVARSGRTVACVIHQPSSQLFNSADDILLLANGRTLYSGALTDIPSTLGKAGFICPQYYNMADYSKLHWKNAGNTLFYIIIYK